MGNLLERKSIKQDFEPKFYTIANLLEAEMDETKTIYDAQKKLKDETHQINVHRNMPDVSGGLKWCQELRDRIAKPMESFKKLIDHPIVHSEQVERIEKKYHEMQDLLSAFSDEIYKDWCDHVGKLSDDNLEKNLINRDAKTNIIKTNFDSQVLHFSYFNKCVLNK